MGISREKAGGCFMIVDAFLNLIRNAIYGDTVTMPTHIGVGNGTTSPAAGDTTLDTEIIPYGSTRCEITTRSKTTSKKLSFQLSLLPSQGNGNAFTEVGLFNSVSSGTMGNRLVHTAINKTSSFELIYQISIEMSEV